MAGHDFTQAARSLSLPVDSSDDDRSPPTHGRRSDQPSWQRRSISNPGELRPRTVRDRWMQNAEKWQRQAMATWYNFTPLQRAGILTLNIVIFIFAILFLVYNERIFAWLSPAAVRWRNLKGGWLILWLLVFFVSLPPMIGYSTLLTIAGFVFGMKGWFIMSTATVAGSTFSFFVSRTVLRDFVGRLTEQNKQFAALSLVLKHDGLKLLAMIRLCPLPYSLSNGAISTIPTVTWQNFALATAIASPKLLLHVFIGSRIGDLAENGDKMDAKTKLVSYLSIAFGAIAGFATGYIVYTRVNARVKQLEAEEAAKATSGRRTPSSGAHHDDDTADRDDVSMHTTAYDDDVEAGYRDEFTDDEDAQERDAFNDDDGDGGYESEEGANKRGHR